MFTYHHERTIDEKGRVSLPASYTALMKEEGAYFSLDNFIGDKPYREFVSEKKISLLADRFIRHAAHQIGEPIMDIKDDNRIIIPREQRNLLQIPEQKSAVVVFGLWHSFGLCAKSLWPDIQRGLLRKKNSTEPRLSV